MEPGIVPVSPEFVAALANQKVKAGDAVASHVANAGFLAMLGGEYVEAEKALRDALAIDPNHIGLLNNLASTVKNLGRDDEAIELYRRALSVDPKCQKVLNNLAVVLLRNNRFEEAWPIYESRMLAQKRFRDIEHPLISGEMLCKTKPATLDQIREAGCVVLAREQGIGDELFFLRWVPVLRDLAGHNLSVYYSPSPKLRVLLTRSNLDLCPLWTAREMHERGGNLPVVALGSLPMVTGTPMVSTPVRIDAGGAHQQIPRLLGVTWRAGIQGSRHLGGLDKSVPLEQLAVALSAWDGDIVAIQHDATTEELDLLRRLSKKTVHPICFYNALLRQAEELARLYEYVGVSNTNMHIFAGLCRTAHVLCPYPAEWRWGARGSSTAWFPGFRVYRQTAYPEASWAPAMEALREAISPRKWWEKNLALAGWGM